MWSHRNPHIHTTKIAQEKVGWLTLSCLFLSLYIHFLVKISLLWFIPFSQVKKKMSTWLDFRIDKISKFLILQEKDSLSTLPSFTNALSTRYLNLFPNVWLGCSCLWASAFDPIYWAILRIFSEKNKLSVYLFIITYI